MAEVENIAENLSTALAGLNVEAGEATERALILIRQLKKASLSLVMAREKEVIMAPKNEYTIYRLITLKI